MENPSAKNNHLVLQTAGITLFSLVMAVFFAFLMAAFLSPGWISGLFNRVGWGGPTVRFAEAQYRRTGSIDDLADLCEATIRFSEDEKAESYLRELIGYDRNGETLETLAQRKDVGEAAEYDYKNYIHSRYASVLYRNGKKEEALTFAADHTTVYHARSPLSFVVTEFVKDPDRMKDYGLLEELMRREESASVAEQKYLWMDLYLVCTAMGEEELANEYLAKINSQNH